MTGCHDSTEYVIWSANACPSLVLSCRSTVDLNKPTFGRWSGRTNARDRWASAVDLETHRHPVSTLPRGRVVENKRRNQTSITVRLTSTGLGGSSANEPMPSKRRNAAVVDSEATSAILSRASNVSSDCSAGGRRYRKQLIPRACAAHRENAAVAELGPGQESIKPKLPYRRR
jgi:hypothetical protein